MRFIAIVALALYGLVLVDAKKCTSPTKYIAKIDIHSNYLIRGQTSKFASLSVPKCRCATMKKNYRSITQNIHRMNTFGSCFFLYFKENCRGQYVQIYSSNKGQVDLGPYQIKGKLYSFQPCFF